jgi:hypothetical protein
MAHYFYHSRAIPVPMEWACLCNNTPKVCMVNRHAHVHMLMLIHASASMCRMDGNRGAMAQISMHAISQAHKIPACSQGHGTSFHT